MSQPKQPIPISKIQKAAEMLTLIANAMQTAQREFEIAGIDTFPMEGWPTLHRGMKHVVDQCSKLASPLSPIQRIDVDELLLDDAKSSDKKLTASELEKLKVAEAKANYRRPKKSHGSRE